MSKMASEKIAEGLLEALAVVRGEVKPNAIYRYEMTLEGDLQRAEIPPEEFYADYPAPAPFKSRR